MHWDTIFILYVVAEEDSTPDGLSYWPVHPQWIPNTLFKQNYTTTKKREKNLFDIDDLVNVLFSLWTEDDFVFIHEVMRIQITFLLLAYYFSEARIGAFLHNGKAEVKGEDGQLDRLVFKGLTWRVRLHPYCRDAVAGELTASQGVHVYLFPLPDGSAKVIIKLVQRWTKNNKDPENSVYAFTVLIAPRS